MKKTFLVIGAVCISAVLVSWGIFGHEHINKGAVLALPQPMQTFFYNHIDFVTQESTVPDLRKYTLSDKAENPRHFIDLENFGSMDSLPKTMSEAKAKYDDKFLSANGFLPWYIEEMMEKLTKSMKEKRKTEILFIAADLGHYIGDAHMPFHTSANHDGQKTNQKGIHALWEAQLPEMFGSKYNLYCGDAKYIDNVHNEIWNIINSSHALVTKTLDIEMELRKKMGEAKMYKKDEKGEVMKNKFHSSIFSDEYATAFHTNLQGMVENQMKLSTKSVASFWYTAWVNAGKPDLNDLDAKEVTDRNSKLMKKDVNQWKTGKMFGMEGEKEF
ncbi:MAG: zinc dependent phospholipase C family protein [Bacteroidota bacterium]